MERKKVTPWSLILRNKIEVLEDGLYYQSVIRKRVEITTVTFR